MMRRFVVLQTVDFLLSSAHIPLQMDTVIIIMLIMMMIIIRDAEYFTGTAVKLVL